jgi:hypothetical protein
MYFFVGLNWSDDIPYTSDAHRVLNGNFYLGKYLPGLRIMMIYPTAFFYSLFGINNFSIALYPLLASLGSIIIIFYLGKTIFNEKIGLLAAFLLAIFPLNIIYGTWLMPDVPIAFFCGLAVLLFIKALKIEKKRFIQLDKRKLLLFASGVSIGISYLHKVTGAIILLVLIPYMIYTIIKKRRIDLDYLFLFVGLGLVLFLEGVFYYLCNGDFFTRFNTVSTFYASGLVSDLMLYPAAMFNLNYNWSFNWDNPYVVHYGLFYYFFILSFIYIIIKRSKKALIPMLWFLFLFLYLEFGSMQITSYVPIHKLPRHLTVLTIPGLLCLSYFLIDFFLKGKKSFSDKKILLNTKRIIVVSVVGFLFATSIFYTYQKSEYLDASTWDMKEIYEYTRDYPDRDIYCDIGTLCHLRFYYKYENDEHIKNLAYVENEYELKDSFIVLNGTRGVIENSLGPDSLPSFVNKPPSNWELVKVISGPKIDIWGIYDPEIYLVR